MAIHVSPSAGDVLWKFSEKPGCFVQIWSVTLQAPTPDFTVYTYTTQISINILGTQNFHRKPPAAGRCSRDIITIIFL